MSWVAGVVGGLVAGGTAIGLSGYARSLVERPASAFLRTPVVGALGLLLGLLAGLKADGWAEVPAYVVVAVAGALLSCTDLADLLIPNKILGPALLATVVLLGVAALVDDSLGGFGRALLCGLVVMVCYFVIAFIRPQQFFLGDVKLSALLGTFLGWLGVGQAVLGAVGAFFLYAVAGIGLLVARKAGRETELPFGPFMVLATVIAAGWGQPILQAWLATMR